MGISSWFYLAFISVRWGLEEEPLKLGMGEDRIRPKEGRIPGVSVHETDTSPNTAPRELEGDPLAAEPPAYDWPVDR